MKRKSIMNMKNFRTEPQALSKCCVPDEKRAVLQAHCGSIAEQGMSRPLRSMMLMLLVNLLTISLFAQAAPVIYKSDFQSQGTQANPLGWVDTAVGQPKPAANGLYKTWPDPVQGNQGTNIVYGTKQSSGKPEGRNPRIGTFTTLTTQEFNGAGRFEYRGRIVRTDADSRIGVTFFSAYPQADSYYLFGLWSQVNSSKLTMQLFASDGHALTAADGSSLDSGVTLEPSKWYGFSVRGQDLGTSTKIEARVWLLGTEEPKTYSIVATDADPKRFTKGRLGFWSAVRGGSFIDDIEARSPVDLSAPTISFYEGANELQSGFIRNADINVAIKVTDDSDPHPHVVAKLDGQPIAETGALVSLEGEHRMEVTATDSVGNVSSRSLTFTIDKVAPVVKVLNGALPFTQYLKEDPTMTIDVTERSSVNIDATYAVGTGKPVSFTSGTKLTEEGSYVLKVTVTDAAGNATVVPPISFTLDKTRPVIEFFRGTDPFSGGAFNDPLAITIKVTDLNPKTSSATLNGASYVSGTTITADSDYKLIATATDQAGNSATTSVDFTINSHGPEVTITANGAPLPIGKFFGGPVKIVVAVEDFGNYTSSITVDGQPFTSGSEVTTEAREHTLVVKVDDDSAHHVTATKKFGIDLHPPVIDVKLDGTALTADKASPGGVLDLSVNDAISSATWKVNVDGVIHKDVARITLDDERKYKLSVEAVDDAGNKATFGPVSFWVDRTKPEVTLLENHQPFPNDFWFSRGIQADVSVVDLTTWTATASISAQTFSLPAVFSTEGDYGIGVTVTDRAGNVTTLDPVPFHIDVTKPVVTISVPHDKDLLAIPSATVSGKVSEIATVKVNGVDATFDKTTLRFSDALVTLLEGTGELRAIAIDRAGNTGEARIAVTVDTRAPEISIVSPLPDVCLDAQNVTVSGAVSDSAASTVQVAIADAAPVNAVIANSLWSVSLPAGSEGRKLITVKATDAAGHTATISRTITIDRTAPSIEITEAGAAFTAQFVNRPIALFVKATGIEDRGSRVEVKLDSQPYVSGTNITGDDEHTLEVTAVDCAGHTAARRVTFTIDTKAPIFGALTPANDATVGAIPARISGSIDEAKSIEIVGTSIKADVTNGTFSLTDPTLAEGTNKRTLAAIDRAGNRSEVVYALTIHTTPPSIEITENGSPLVDGALFNRDITPTIRATSTLAPQSSIAAVTATLDNQPFISGTSITTEGAHQLRVTATDEVSHTAMQNVTFTIDKTAPRVTITQPSAGTVDTDVVVVRGTAGDSISVLVNGVTALLGSDHTFSATVPIETGDNLVVATGRDAAGNTGRAEVAVTRSDAGPAILLSYPADHTVTNRPKTDILGRVVTPSRTRSVAVRVQGPGKTADLPATIDPTGAFHLTDIALVEGTSTITATAVSSEGKSTSVAVTVTVDLTPPSLKVLANTKSLEEGARFPQEAAITLEATDNNVALNAQSLTLFVDGEKKSVPVTITATGGHTLVATATDSAGNQTRVERTFYIGSAGAAGCDLRDFDPKSGAVISSATTTLVGHCGGAAGVKVNDIPAIVANGSFCASVELTLEGDNPVRIVCTDAAGSPTGTPVNLILTRVTGSPSVTITTPTELAEVGVGSLSVSGSVSDDARSLDLNGAIVTLPPRPNFSKNVALTPGLNTIVARARNAAGKTSFASRRVIFVEDKRALTITSPLPDYSTAAPTIDISGTFENIVPTTLTLNSAPLDPRSSILQLDSTRGTFTIPALTLAVGDNTFTISGRDSIGRSQSAVVTVKKLASGPWITITSPADNSWFGASSTQTEISGTFSGAEGSRVEVNGVGATLTGNQFTGIVRFALGATPVVARVLEPTGRSAYDSIVITRLGSAPTVKQTFPAANATGVDPAVMPLVNFSARMNLASLQGGGFRLETANGTPVSGVFRLEADVLLFAPAAQLTSNETYKIRITTAAKDLGGNSVASEVVSSFTVGGSAPASGPALDAVPQTVCAPSLAISGTTSAGAELRIESSAFSATVSANAEGRFTYPLPLSGRTGFTVVRVSTLGSDGSVSPASELKFLVDCGGPEVSSATFDRTVNKLTIVFTKNVDLNSATVGSSGAIVIQLSDGTIVGGSAILATPTTLLINPAADLVSQTFTILVNDRLKDTTGRKLSIPFSQTFTASDDTPITGNGTGFITGEVFDASTGRPLAGATVSIEVPTSGSGSRIGSSTLDPQSSILTTSTDSRGKYVVRLPEGAHTLRVTAATFTVVYRQILVPAGAGVVPIDIRLTKLGKVADGTSNAITVDDGKLTRKVTLTASTPLTANTTLTPISAQSLAGLLPLGWSPYASAEVRAAASPLTATLTFDVDAVKLTQTAQTLTAVQYDSARDEWRVIASAVTIQSRAAIVNILTTGAYALVYADKAPLARPQPATSGDVLHGVADPCASTPCALKADGFTLDPKAVTPQGKTTATLTVSTLDPQSPILFPSGTAVQASIDETLTLADGSKLLDPPFATDLLLYRTLDGAKGEAQFHLAPSRRAGEVILQEGVDHIRIQPYPGRLDRGALIGSEGGRVPGDGTVAVDIPEGATPEPLHASVNTATFTRAVKGFEVLGAFTVDLTRATQPTPIDGDGDGQLDPVIAPELFKPARVTFSANATAANQLILAELLSDGTVRLASLTQPLPDAATKQSPLKTASAGSARATNSLARFTTRQLVDLPLDGVIRPATYLILKSTRDIAFATGTVRRGSPTGAFIKNATVESTPPLPVNEGVVIREHDVTDVTRSIGTFAIPIPVGAFSLTPAAAGTGRGAAQPVSASAKDQVVTIVLPLLAQPPVIVMSVPDPATDVLLDSDIRISVVGTNVTIDPASITETTLTVTDTSTGLQVSGKTQTVTTPTTSIVWKLKTDVRFKANGRYSVTVAPTLRTTAGALLSQTKTFTFSTKTQIVSNDVHPNLIRITIPDAGGQSTISGTSGAVPPGARVLPLRRGSTFRTQYQTTADSNGAFSFTIGATDPVTIRDTIDLQVISGGLVVAVIRLTPFVGTDGISFVAAVDAESRFSLPTSDGPIVVTVPAGAFEEPTLVTLEKSDKDAFTAVPSFEKDLSFANAVKLNFEGVAKKRLQLELPIPAGVSTAGKDFLLGNLGQSIRGPRVMIVDTLIVAGGKLTTVEGSAAKSRTVVGVPKPNAVYSGSDVKNFLLGVNRSGIYAAVDIKTPSLFGIISGLSAGYDFFCSEYNSLYLSSNYLAESRGAVAIPVPLNTPFSIVGVDASTGLEAMSLAYAPILPGNGAAVSIDSPEKNLQGPYPIFGDPFRIEILEVGDEGVPVTIGRNFVATLRNGILTIVDGLEKLPADVSTSVLNPSTGALDSSRESGLAVAAKKGDRVLLLIGRTNIDAGSRELSVVFNEPIFVGSDSSDAAVDAFLKPLFKIEKAEAALAGGAFGSFQNVTEFAHLSSDSGGRRILIQLPALDRGALYRLTLSKEIADRSGANSGPGLKIGQVVMGGQTTAPLASGIQLFFTVRAPAGVISNFTIASGSVRDMALNGNVLLMTALEGGLLAYDTSDPAGIKIGTPPLGYARSEESYWALASDHHGRVFTTSLSGYYGILRSYRLEDFAPDAATSQPPHIVSKSRASAAISFAPGVGLNVGVSTDSVLSDIPEAIPRKLQIAIQDTEDRYITRAAFKSATGASTIANVGNDFEKLSVSIPMTAAFPYNLQRITVENLSADMTWSAEATPTLPARIENIIAREGDTIRVLRNQRTYGVVTLFGYGVSVVDLNAIDSNDAVEKATGYIPAREKIRLTNGADDPSCKHILSPAAIQDLTFSPDSAILTQPESSSLFLYSVETRKGVLDLKITPPSTSGTTDLCDERISDGLVLRSSSPLKDHPRLAELRARFKALTGQDPVVRFTGVATYRWRLENQDNKALRDVKPGELAAPGARGSIAGQTVTRDYLLIPASQYGLLVVEAAGNPGPQNFDSYRPLLEFHLVDVIWIPTGAYAVRPVPRSNLATVVDGEGHIVIVDLTKIDERFSVYGDLLPGSQLFRTAANCLSAKGAYGVGTPDPRIVWRSEEALVAGAFAPVIDGDTGILYAGDQKTVSAVSTSDPHIRIKVDLGANGGLSEVTGIVPLGIDPPRDIQDTIAEASPARRPDASLGAFRLEVTLPGNFAKSVTGGEFRMALESERVSGALMPQTPASLPRSHLRKKAADALSDDPRAANGFVFERVVPSTMEAGLRRQRGFNKFVSPWIVAIADPRASVSYDWKSATAQQKRDAGCFSCDRPRHLAGLNETNGTWEIYSTGRDFALRPEMTLSSSPYKYLAAADRLSARFVTVMADTVRTPDVLTAAQNPPVGDGLLGTVYLHSGELEVNSLDLNAGGRAGWNVAFDRTYRSRTIGGSSLGLGWESSNFRRLRSLPNGGVEYRDGSGEVWLFKARTPESLGGGVLGPVKPTVADYVSPRGLFLRLVRTNRGWTMTDQKWRITTFDELGRLSTESDEFREVSEIGLRGNTIRYLYDGSGRLGQIIDPVSRVNRFAYWSDDAGVKGGLLSSVTDWRDRSVDYDYDSEGRLNRVQLVNVPNTTGGRPTIQYGYAGSSSSFNDRLDLSANLFTITDPIGGEPRLTVAYGSTATDRDRATLLQTSTGEKSGVTYSTLSAETSSPLGQVRSYELTAQPKEYAGDRSHVAKVTERAVVTASGVGELPAGIAPGGYPTQARDRVTSFTYHEEGMVLSSRLEGVRESTTTYQDVNKSGANGFIVQSIITKPLISASAKRSSNPVSSLVAQSLGEAITLTPTYQTSTNASTFVDSISANGLEVVAPEAHRGNSTDPEHPLTVTNSSVTTETLYGDDGLILSMKSHGGNDGGTGESFTKVTYKPIDAAPFERALPSSVDNGGVASKIDYGLNTVTETDERDVVTRTTFDTWRRPISIHVEKPDDSLKLDETYQYDANGRLSIHTRQQDLATVATTFEYDALGRRTKVTTDNIAVDGVKTSLSTTTAYDIPNHRIVTTAPSGAISTTELDALGRVVRSATSTNSSDPIETRVAYDADDNVVYSTDMLTASGAAFDVHGRQLLSQASDGTQSVTTYDAWGHPKSVIAYDSASQKIAGGTLDFTADGRLNKTTTEVDALLSRSTDFRWDGGGRTSAIATSGRASKTEYDLAGRVKKAQAGKGTTTAISDVFSSADVSAYSGYLPTATKTAEKGSAGYESTTSYDSAGNATLQQLGNLEWKQTFDEAGNIKSASQPGRSAANYDHDARGALLTETMPDGAALQNRFDKNGSQTEYKDPTGQKTIDTTDLVGRPLTRTYPDSTTEVYTYERSRIKTYKDRQNRTKVYGYNNRGQLTDIHFQGDVTLDHFDYDPAGRLLAWTNKDASIAWSDFTRDGNPQKTTQTRYKNGSGLGSREVLDEFVQDHKWNEHGERIEWSMPHATSTTAPPLLAPWTDRLSASYDAMGNVDGVERKLAGGGGFSALLTSHSRNSGRPDSRTITSSCGSAPCSAGSILRSYTYDSTTGQLNGMRVTSNGLIVAGALITHFDGLQLSEQQLLGVSNDSRFSHWTYDARSRLATTTIGRALEQKLTQSDFREKLVREPRFDEATRAAMAAKGIAVQRLDPPTQTATETPAAHKIASIAQGSEARTFTYNGAERSGDARFDYEWDEKGRLVRATQHIGDPAPPAIMRVSYVYDGRDRMVGRRVEIAQTSSPATWQPAPSAVLTDGIPAEATIVWDPISDTIAAVYDSNTGALVRQVINGSLSYDDPLEVTVAQASSSPNPQSPILRLYPIYDESGTGNLQAVLNSSGEVVSRNIVDDAYGEETFSLGGAAIDRVAVTATKKSSGALDSVEVTMRSTEPLRPSTLAIGTRLAVVDAGGAVVRSSNATPQLFDNNYAVRWTLTAAEWQTLTVDGAALSIAATKNLRASTFNAETPVLPAPNWATATRPIFTTSEVPVEVRESLAALSTFLASIPSGDKTETLYEAKDLALAGSDKQSDDPSRFLLNAAFQAVPFFDSVTRHSYVRARWLDHATGTWLSPDPLGYRDSSNLYAFAGGDPVNRRDPSGSNWTVGSSALKIVEETEWAIKGVEAGVEVAEVSAAVSPVGVGIVLFEGGRWAISKYAEHVEAKADSYVDEQLQFANEIKTRARKRRNSGQIIVPRMPGVTPWSQQTQLLPPGSAAARQADIQHNEQVGAPDKKAKNRWQYIREWHDKRATDIFGPGLGRRVGTRADGNLRTYDKYYRDYDVEYKSDNFSKAPRAPQRISDLTRQIQKDITNKGLGLANPYWHFEHDPRVAREMDPLLRALDDAGIPWGVGPEPMIFQQ